MRCHDCGNPVTFSDSMPRSPTGTLYYCQACIDLAVAQASDDIDRQLALVQLSEQRNRILDDAILTRHAAVQRVADQQFDSEYRQLVDQYKRDEATRFIETVEYNAHREQHFASDPRLTGKMDGKKFRFANERLIEREAKLLMEADPKLSLADAYERVSIIFPGWFR